MKLNLFREMLYIVDLFALVDEKESKTDALQTSTAKLHFFKNFKGLCTLRVNI